MIADSKHITQIHRAYTNTLLEKAGQCVQLTSLRTRHTYPRCVPFHSVTLLIMFGHAISVLDSLLSRPRCCHWVTTPSCSPVLPFSLVLILHLVYRCICLLNPPVPRSTRRVNMWVKTFASHTSLMDLLTFFCIKFLLKQILMHLKACRAFWIAFKPGYIENTCLRRQVVKHAKTYRICNQFCPTLMTTQQQKKKKKKKESKPQKFACQTKPNVPYLLPQ